MSTKMVRECPLCGAGFWAYDWQEADWLTCETARCESATVAAQDP